MRRIAAAGLLALALGMTAPPVAGAGAPERQGWWEGESELGPLGDPLAGLGSIDVPDDGLLVQGGRSEPAAFAAATFPVGSQEIAGPLRLVPHPDAASVPGSTIEVCPLDDPAFEPARGGSPDDAPAYDCFGAVPATVEEDGTFAVDVTTLRRGDHVAVAILPASQSTRIVLQTLGDDALPLSPIDAGGTPPPRPPAPGPSALPPTSADTGVVAAPVDPPAAAPVRPAPADLPAPAAEAPDASVTDGVFGGAPVVSRASTGDAGLAIAFGVAAVLGAALWFVAGQLGVARSRAVAT